MTVYLRTCLLGSGSPVRYLAYVEMVSLSHIHEPATMILQYRHWPLFYGTFSSVSQRNSDTFGGNSLQWSRSDITIYISPLRFPFSTVKVVYLFSMYFTLMVQRWSSILTSAASSLMFSFYEIAWTHTSSSAECRVIQYRNTNVNSGLPSRPLRCASSWLLWI